MMPPLVSVPGMLITGIAMGYTLQPVPKSINALFDDSMLFRTVMLSLAGIFALSDNLNASLIIFIIICSVGIQLLFDAIRKYDKTVSLVDSDTKKKIEISVANTN